MENNKECTYPSSKSKEISKMRHHETIVHDKQNIAELFNDYFSTIGSNLAQTIPTTTKSVNDYLPASNLFSLFMLPTNEKEVNDIVNSLKKNKSPGFDNITNELLKSIIDEIVTPLTYIFNLSMSSGVVPDKMKIAKVIPIFKKGDAQDCSNYRPISLLTTFSKILERLVYNRTINFFTRHKILSDRQFGFRENHTTSHAILHFINKIASALDNRCHTVGLFLDFSKAFYTIDHNIIMQKLHYGVRGRLWSGTKAILRIEENVYH